MSGKTLLISEKEKVDLGVNGWDEKLAMFLKEKKGIDQDKALSITRFLKEQLQKIDLKIIPVSMIEKMIEAKLIEYGIIKESKIKIDGSIFKETRLPLSENAIRVLKKRYLKTDENGNVIETPEDMFRRVAHHIALAEEKYGATPEEVRKIEEIFYKMMSELKFLPNSPTLMNAGRELGQLAACFVLPVEDSMEGIFDALKYAALIHKSGGGTGFSFSRLRPKNSRVGTTGGVASGPVSFMKIFNTATEQVKQGGTRRGANMAILRVDHPDIMEFIYSKKNTNELNNFNISVAVTEKFMKAVQEGTNYDLIDPRTGKKAGELNAREVYKAMIECAWETGDPGIVFLDRINKDNPTPELGEIESTNPCVTSDTWVMTSEGARQVKELIGKKFTAVLNGEDFDSDGFFFTGVKKVLKLKTKEGFEIRLTKEHPVLKVKKITRHTIETEWCKAGELKKGDKIVLNNHRGIDWNGSYSEPEGYLIGLLLGDGTIKNDKVLLSSWEEKTGAKSVREAAYNYRMTTAYLKKLATELELKTNKKRITEKIEKASSGFCIGLLRGLFDADGTVIGNHKKGVSVRLAQSDLEFLKTVQRILLRLGIFSKIYHRREAGTHLFPDGKGGKKEYNTKDQYELVISNDSIVEFYKRIGFNDIEKMKRLEESIESYKRSINRDRFVSTVEEIVPDGLEDVYDVRVPYVNAFDANGFIVHNCGEQPLLPYEACNLGSINLAKFVVREKDGRLKIDYEALKETVWYAVRFLDNVIDVSKYPLPKIEEMVRGNRKIGLGVMGFADVLFQLMIPYDSEEALLLAEEIMSFMQKEAHEASKELAEERGVFPNFDKSIYKNRPDCRYRNATVTTIAPTGTLSIIAGCSSGIEPAFALCFVRNVMDNDRLLEVNPYFEKVAKERGFYSKELMEKIVEKGSIQDIEEIPADVKRVFVTAHDIAPEWHVRMQAAFQKYTDNAVSKTVNLPHDATVEDVKKVYDLAYKLKLKGITIYRDGSKQNQVLTLAKDKTRKEQEEVWVKERPETLPGFTTKVTTGMGNLYITVTEYEGKPFEVFAIIGKSGRSTTAKTEAIGRLISLCLRAGVSVEEIVDQLKGIGGEYPVFQKDGLVLSIPDAIARVLEKRYLKGKKEEKKKTHLRQENDLTGGRCPECGEKLSFEEGRMKCYSCGFSSC